MVHNDKPPKHVEINNHRGTYSRKGWISASCKHPHKQWPHEQTKHQTIPVRDLRWEEQNTKNNRTAWKKLTREQFPNTSHCEHRELRL